MSQIFKPSTGGGGGGVTSVTGTHGVTAAPTTGNVVVSGVNATTTTVGVASFNAANFTVTAGAVSSLPITVIGAGGITITGSPVNLGGTITITGSVTSATTYTENTGTATPAGNILNILGARVVASVTPVATTGSGNTVTVNVQTTVAQSSSSGLNAGLASFNSAQFTVDANGFVSLTGSVVGETITGNSGGAVSPTAGNWNILGAAVAAGTTPVTTVGVPATSTLTVDVQRSQAIASTNASNVGLAAFNSAQFTVDANGFVSITNFTPFAYTAVTHATGSPYVVLATDYYISCDPTAGTITINLPNAPTLYREFVIKDRTGQASTNNISITTVGGAVTIDGQTTYTIAGNFGAVQLLWNGTSYEVF